jgi:hypothetical protein
LQVIRDDLFRQQQIAAEQGNADLVKAIAINLATVESAIAAQQEAKEIALQERKLERQKKRAAAAVSTGNTVIATMDAEIRKLEEELSAYQDFAERGLNPVVNLQEKLAQEKDKTESVLTVFETGFRDAAVAGQELAQALRDIKEAFGFLGAIGNVLGFLVDPFWDRPRPNFKRRALGGPVSGGQQYMVGERGPELFVPNQSGNIVPNNAIGGQVNVTVSAGAFLGSSDDAREFARRVYGALNDEAKRRGAVLGGSR